MKKKLHMVWFTIYTLCKWIVFGVVTGGAVGVVGALFYRGMEWVTGTRTENPVLIYFLPLAGLVIVFLYKIFKYENNNGTNEVIEKVHSDEKISLKMAPLITVSTLITHLFGGSAGREGAALQMGGSLADGLSKILHVRDKERDIVIMCGMSAGFASLFGTPMASAIFSLEVVEVGVMHYSALVPCVFSSFIAYRVAGYLGAKAEFFKVTEFPDMEIMTFLEMLLLAVVLGGLSILFCIVLHKTEHLFKQYIKNAYTRIFVAGIAIVLITMLVGNNDYNGTGMPVIERAFEGEVFPAAFLIKLLLTALTLGAGFRGGEIVPTFFVGATFGAVIAPLLGLPVSLCAACGMIGVFSGVTNCPLTALLIGFELFGFEGMPYYLIISAVCYMLSGYFGVYSAQRIMYSKYKPEFINRKTR